MLNEAGVVAFVACTDADRTKKFYGEVLGLSLVSDDPFAVVFDAHGTMLRVQKVRELVPAKHTVLGWRVADIWSEAEQLRQRGVTFDRYEGLQQDELGIWASPSGALVAWFKDPDGNTLSLTQFP